MYSGTRTWTPMDVRLGTVAVSVLPLHPNYHQWDCVHGDVQNSRKHGPPWACVIEALDTQSRKPGKQRIKDTFLRQPTLTIQNVIVPRLNPSKMVSHATIFSQIFFVIPGIFVSICKDIILI